jgi:hypothetical protein
VPARNNARQLARKARQPPEDFVGRTLFSGISQLLSPYWNVVAE